jgi:hypothetical protein
MAGVDISCIYPMARQNKQHFTTIDMRISEVPLFKGS